MPDDLKALEARFDAWMEDGYIELKRKYHYNASYFHQMLLEYGGVETARRLLMTDQPSEGFTTLWMLGGPKLLMEMSVEGAILNPEYTPLFTDVERNIARQRLIQNGCKLDD